MHTLKTMLATALVGLTLAACGAGSPSAPSASTGATAGSLPDATSSSMTQPTSAAMPDATSGSMTQPTSAAMPDATSGSMTQPTAGSASTAGTSTAGSAQATINQIAAAAADWYGKPVTVSGDVSQVYNNLAFAVNDPAASSAGAPLLVIMPSGVTLSQGQSVQVSGTVQQLDIAQIEKDLGITLDPSLSGMAGKPVIIASQVNG